MAASIEYEKWYDLELGPTHSKESDAQYILFRYDFKPPMSGSGTLYKEKNENRDLGKNEVVAQFEHKDPEKDRFHFRGHTEHAQEHDALLIFDGSIMRLERVHQSMLLKQDRTAGLGPAAKKQKQETALTRATEKPVPVSSPCTSNLAPTPNERQNVSVLQSRQSKGYEEIEVGVEEEFVEEEVYETEEEEVEVEEQEVEVEEEVEEQVVETGTDEIDRGMESAALGQAASGLPSSSGTDSSGSDSDSGSDGSSSASGSEDDDESASSGDDL